MTIENVLNETYLIEETAYIILKIGILGNVMMYGSINGKKGQKPVQFADLPESLKKRFLKVINKRFSEITDVEEYVKSQKKPVKFSMVSGILRFVDDGKPRTSNALSDMELQDKYMRK